MTIPFHKPWYDEEDERALRDALLSGTLVGDGPYTRKACAELSTLLGAPHVLLTTSCTHALELAMMVLQLGAGDEVIVPSFTFVSTTNCILRQGARVVFADILPDTLTLDPEDVRRRLTSATKAVVPIVYAGVPPRLDELLELCRGREIALVEDAAQGLGVTYRGRPVGAIGDIGCLSFHETKNISTGEGGAFLTSDPTLWSRAEIVREKGTNRRQFLQGLVDKYSWVDVGSSFLPPDSTGALLLSQLAKHDRVQKRRRAIYERYQQAFAPLAAQGLLQLPVIPPYAVSNYHIYHVLMADEATRNRAIEFFRSRGVSTTFHYLPLHLSPMGRRLGFGPGNCPVTESASVRLLRLPIYPGLTEDEQRRVIAAMEEFFTR